MVRSIVIPQDPTQRPWLQEFVHFGEFQLIVDGWLDFMEIPALGVTVYMNQAARRKNGVMNARATALWWYYSAQPLEHTVILGDVVLTGIADEEFLGDVPDSVVRQLLERDSFIVQVSPHGDGVWFDWYAGFDNFFDAAIWCSLFGLAMRGGPQFRIDEEPPIDKPTDAPLSAGTLPSAFGRP